MRNLYSSTKFFFVAVVTVYFVYSCKPRQNQLTLIQAKNIEIANEEEKSVDIENFIEPYKQHVHKEMATVLAYNPTDLVKENDALIKETDVLNTAIGNFLADASFEIINPIFSKRTGKNIDFVLLNWGGIRSDLPKGDLTVGSAYNVMPFENKFVIVEMKGETVNELFQYLTKAKKPHPLSHQIELQITKDGKIKKATVGKLPIDTNKTYLVGTSDYLMNGGDGMNFFQKRIELHETDYLIRNILIDYFKKIDTLETTKDNRFTFAEN